MLPILPFQTSQVAQWCLKNLPAMQEMCIQSLGLEDPLEEGIAIHSSFLPGESQGQRSLMGYSPQGHKELDTTEVIVYACKNW